MVLFHLIMMLFITYSTIGIFALDQKKNIVEHALFPRDPEKIIERIERIKKGEVIPELEEILKKIKDKDIVTDIPFKDKNFNIEYKKKISAHEILKEKQRKLAIKLNFAKSQSELNKILSEMQIIKTKRKIKFIEKKDRIAMQAVSAIDDLTDISNRFSERLHEWYGLYYPELERKIKDNKKYAEIISENLTRESIDNFSETMGMDLDEYDLKILNMFSKETKNIFELNEELEEYIEKIMNGIAPNVTGLVGAKLGAKLILLAGGLEKLAKLPSSTIQLLGAEKALFRFMKSKKKSRPPKYGILFLHPEVTNAPDNMKGKVARVISSMISKAAKTDFYIKEDKSKFYREEFERKIKNILKRN